MGHAQSDPLATCQTQTLYQQLKNLAPNNLLFGHQNTTFEGIGWEDWSGFQDRSDCLEAVGDYPAIYGFDFVRGFLFQRHTIKAHERGAIITFSDHMDNFANRGDAWNTNGNTVSEILRENSGARNLYIIHLNRVASFFRSLNDKNGELIPVIYRPFHENSGDWFWWGAPHCSPEEFVALWRLTVDYLRNERGIHHVLFAYSPSDPAFRGGYGDRYPGDDYVDIVGFDSYEVLFYDMFLKANSKLIVEFAEVHNKIPALTEFGVNGGIQFANETNWFTNSFLQLMKEDTFARQLAYAHTWRNDRPNHHWVPLPESPTHADFVQFYEDDFTIFEKDLPDVYTCDQITTSLFEKKINNSLVISPNPATDYIQIKESEPMLLKKGSTILIFDSVGRKIQQLHNPTNSETIDVSNLPKGIYFLVIKNADQLFGSSSFIKT